jgi:hypothetical protein
MIASSLRRDQNTAPMPLTKKRTIWWLALLLCGVGLMVVFLLSESPRAELLTQPAAPRRSRIAFLGQWGTPVRNAWLKLKFRWAKPPRSVSIAAQIFEVDGVFSVTNAPWPAPELSSDSGVQVWILSSNQISAVRARVDQTGISVSSPTVSTREQMPAKISVNHRVATSNLRVPLSNIELDFLPRTRGQSVELASFLMVGEWARLTNVAIGARVLIPEGQSMFLLTTNRADARKQIGLIATPTVR